MLTWSLGCAPPPARLAITSLAFMFDEVPEPVWKTSIGNWSSWRPSAISSPPGGERSATPGVGRAGPPAAIGSPTDESSRPSSAFTPAVAPLMRPSQRTTGSGTRSPDTGKFATALVVSPPHSCCGVSCTLIRSSGSIAWFRHYASAAMSTADSPIGARGRVTSTGGIRPGRTGEVMLAIRGGVEAFMARDGDGGAIEPYTEVVVIDYEPPRVVIVSALPEEM